MVSLLKMIKEINLTKLNRYGFMFINMNEEHLHHFMCYFESSLCPSYFETVFPCSCDVLVFLSKGSILHSDTTELLASSIKEHIWKCGECFLWIEKGMVHPTQQRNPHFFYLLDDCAALINMCLSQLVIFQRKLSVLEALDELRANYVVFNVMSGNWKAS